MEGEKFYIIIEGEVSFRIWNKHYESLVREINLLVAKRKSISSFKKQIDLQIQTLRLGHKEEAPLELEMKSLEQGSDI
jgi:hypothetical protein